MPAKGNDTIFKNRFLWTKPFPFGGGFFLCVGMITALYPEMAFFLEGRGQSQQINPHRQEVRKKL